MTFIQNAWYVAAWQENALKNEDKVVVEEDACRHSRSSIP
jgi:hypothetical protein